MQIERNLASEKEVFIRILDRFSQLNNAFLKKEHFDKFATTRTHAHARAASMEISSRYKNKRNKTNQLNMTSQHFNMTIKEPLFKDVLKATFRSQPRTQTKDQSQKKNAFLDRRMTAPT